MESIIDRNCTRSSSTEPGVTGDGASRCCVSTVGRDWPRIAAGHLPLAGGRERLQRSSCHSCAVHALCDCCRKPRSEPTETRTGPRAGSSLRLPAAHAEHELPLPPPPGCTSGTHLHSQRERLPTRGQPCPAGRAQCLSCSHTRSACTPWSLCPHSLHIVPGLQPAASVSRRLRKLLNLPREREREKLPTTFPKSYDPCLTLGFTQKSQLIPAFLGW